MCEIPSRIGYTYKYTYRPSYSINDTISFYSTYILTIMIIIFKTKRKTLYSHYIPTLLEYKIESRTPLKRRTDPDELNSHDIVLIFLFKGLDPASPLFGSFLVSNEVLDKSDAQFVDVVHTNIGVKGKKTPLGHLDFYANNAYIQPGCGRSNI